MNEWLLRLVLAPALAPALWLEGRHVRRTIVKLPEPDGPREGTLGNGHPLKLVILGDSAAAGVGSSHQSQALSGHLCQRLSQRHQVDWRLIARSGETTASFLQFLDNINGDARDIAIVSLGVNDVTSNLSLSAYKLQTQRLIQRIREKFDSPHILFSGLPPMGRFPALPQPLRWYLGARSRYFDAALREVAQHNGCDYVPAYDEADDDCIASDGFHPGPKAYALWAGWIDTHLQQQYANKPS